jgi:hypothetical protein
VEGEKEAKPYDREETNKFEIGGKKPMASAAAPSKVASEGSESARKQNSSKVENDDGSIEVVDPTEIDKQAATTNDSSKTNTTNDKDYDSDIEVVEVSTPLSATASNMNVSASRMPLKSVELIGTKPMRMTTGLRKLKLEIRQLLVTEELKLLRLVLIKDGGFSRVSGQQLKLH